MNCLALLIVISVVLITLGFVLRAKDRETGKKFTRVGGIGCLIAVVIGVVVVLLLVLLTQGSAVAPWIYTFF